MGYPVDTRPYGGRPTTVSEESRAAGERLHAAIREAMGRSHTVRNLNQLSQAAGVSRSTFYEWFSGMQEPGTRTLSQVAAALDVPTADLFDAYEGRETVAPPESMADLTEAVRALVARLDRIATGAIREEIRRQLEGGQEEEPLPPARRRQTPPKGP